jgi:hypothetical protein
MRNKIFFIVGLVIAFVFMFEFAAFADSSDQETKLTFSQPVEIPGQVLPAGTYVFELADHGEDLNVVQVYNADRSHLYATLQTFSAERPQATDRTAISLVDQGAGQPYALLKWFYPGQITGNEFEYPKQEEKNLANEKQQTILTDQQPVSTSEAAGAAD